MFIITTVPDALIFFQGQISYLSKEFNITLVSSAGDKLVKKAKEHGVNYHSIEMKREISVFNDLLSLFKLLFFFFKEKPDIVHGNTPKASFLSMIASYIVGVKTRIYYIHGLRYEGEKGIKRKVLMFIEKISTFLATNIFVVSNGLVNELKKNKITRKKVSVIGNGSINGINSDFFDPSIVQSNLQREELLLKNTDFVFGFVGRLVGDKGINELVTAFSRIQEEFVNAKLLLIGRYEEHLNPIKPEIKKEIEENSSIFFLGFKEDVRPYYKIMDLFVFPSYREGFGVSLMEAGAMSIPSISSNITGCNEIVKNNVNGFLIPARDAKALYDKMKFCIENKEVMRKMKKNSRNVIVEAYEQKKHWEEVMKIYKIIS
ncbi:glycosyltransferase family 4 protein [Tenacibaculum holothuriorum]|nr:glycosyltransferase family 4 protein [Tenacibaculum holothuriorum]